MSVKSEPANPYVSMHVDEPKERTRVRRIIAVILLVSPFVFAIVVRPAIMNGDWLPEDVQHQTALRKFEFNRLVFCFAIVAYAFACLLLWMDEFYSTLMMILFMLLLLPAIASFVFVLVPSVMFAF